MSDVNRYAAVSRVGHPADVSTADGEVTFTDMDEAVIRAALGVYREFVVAQACFHGEGTAGHRLWSETLTRVDAVTAKMDGE